MIEKTNKVFIVSITVKLKSKIRYISQNKYKKVSFF